MAEQKQTELTAEQREQLINTVLWELAGRAMQAARLTGDPRLQAIAAVAAEQVKTTSSFDSLLINYVQNGQQQAQQSKNPSTQNAFAMAQQFAQQQNDHWQAVIKNQVEQDAFINEQITALTLDALRELKARRQTFNGGTDGSQAGSTDSATGNASVPPASVPVQQ